MNLFAEELGRPLTLPSFRLPPFDDAEDRRELAQRLAEARIVRAGAEAWAQIARTQSFRAWADVGKALLIGKARAQQLAYDGKTWREKNYIYEFSKWMKANGFGGIPKSVRSVAIELAENLPNIEAWRATLPERQRKQLVHPLSNVRRWRAATTFGGKSPADYKMEAVAAWRKFVSCVAMLPPDQAAPLWQTVRMASNAT
jgi:hypothetical protein